MNLSPEFIENTKKILGKEWDAFAAALDGDTPTSIRINTSKHSNSPINAEKVKWCESGYYLPSRPTYTFDPLFHAGCYYPQEASSMFVEQVVKEYVTGDVKVLDLCAAPGGKSTLLLSLITENSLLVSNEVIRSRANILSENITKWGYSNSVVTNNDPSDIGKLTDFFDAILVDAPCSGEGMFRKDPTALSEWSEANVRLCKERQQRILADVWNTLKPDGILIYSTCTYNTHENEDNVEWACETLGAEAVKLTTNPEWNITGALKGDLPVYRFLPHKTKGEGFFLAVMRKTGSEENTAKRDRNFKKKDRNNKNKSLSLAEPHKKQIANWSDCSFVQRNNVWSAIPSNFEADFQYLASNLKIVSAGIEIGEQKGKDFIPSQSLALSNNIASDEFTRYETDWKTAISYLRKEAITLNGSYPKGYVLLTHKNKPLGFIKNIGNRTNNLYPQEWRIRTSNIPDSFEPII